MRPSGRAPDALRDISFTTGFARHAEGSCLIRMGGTEVLCAASVEGRVPPFLRGKGEGWVTAEYGMLPRATHTRGDREAARGKQSGRTQEIQRLIGRSLRAVVDRKALGEMTVTLDCDVLNADGGTRCAAITGAWVALSLALAKLVENRVIAQSPLTGQVAAVSCGLVDGAAVLDLDYAEDSQADADANFVLTESGIVEIQGTAERAPFSDGQFAELMRLARGDRLVLASHNPGKLREIEALLVPFGVAVESAGSLGLSEPDETAPDFAGNARLKAVAAAQATGLPALADDSGFCVAALGGAPGVLSARWAGPAKDFAAAMQRVHDQAGRPSHAWFICALCLAWPGGETAPFLGRVDGQTCWPPRGDKGFGYDPMFVPIGALASFGEMDPAAKHASSHRARAFAALVAACLQPVGSPPRSVFTPA